MYLWFREEYRGLYIVIKLLYLEILHGAAGARDAFEDLCYELIKSQFPDLEVRHVEGKQGDGGIDVYVGDLTDPHGIEVFQAKFFDREVGESQKDQIRKSFKRCVTNPEFKVSKWTLCLPRNLSLDEAKWFASWKKDEAQASSLPSRNIVLWNADDLERILDEPDNVTLKEKYFNQEQLTHIREIHGMLIELTKEIYNLMGGPIQETVKIQLKKLLDNNNNIVTSILQTAGITTQRFSISQRNTIENNILATFPSLYDRVYDLFQALETGNRLIDHAYTRSQNPRLPIGFDLSQPFSIQDLHVGTQKAILDTQEHAARVIYPLLIDLLTELQNLE